MYILINADADVTVEDTGDLTRLHVSHEVPADRAGMILTATGQGEAADDGHVWLDVAWLRATTDDPGWQARFDGMIAYAKDHGWCSPDGRQVRAHLQPAGPS